MKYFRYQNNHVSPSEIESILQEHPDIKECIVFGKKDPTVQELISAVIVPADNKEVSIMNLFLMIIRGIFWFCGQECLINSNFSLDKSR